MAGQLTFINICLSWLCAYICACLVTPVRSAYVHNKFQRASKNSVCALKVSAHDRHSDQVLHLQEANIEGEAARQAALHSPGAATPAVYRTKGAHAMSTVCEAPADQVLRCVLHRLQVELRQLSLYCRQFAACTGRTPGISLSSKALTCSC